MAFFAPQGGGIYNFGTLSLANSIVAGNTTRFSYFNGSPTDSPSNMYGSLTANSSLIGNSSNATITGGDGENVLDQDPLLGTLGSHGGTVQTVPLLRGSPAIDAGDDSLVPAEADTDERGWPRIVDGNADGIPRIDMGAVEYQAAQEPPELTVLDGTTAIASGASDYVGRAMLGQSAPSKTFTIRNDGVESLILTTPFASTDHFTVGQPSKTVLAGGETTTFTVTMDPSAPYSGYENVSFENNGGSYGVESAFTFSAGGAILDPASFIVNTAADVSDPNDGLTSLREAIAWANSTPGDDTITFNPSLAGQTIILTGGQLELTDTAGVTTITGLGADQLTIDGNQASRIFKINSSVTADISGVTIANGKGGDDGGGIYNAGVLSIADSTISGNSAWHTGGGVYNSGTLNIADCTLAGNSSGDYGGGIYNDAGSMTSTAGTVTITDSTLSDNSASDNGGGIFNQGTLTITNSTLSGNSANGAAVSTTMARRRSPTAPSPET